MVKIWTRVVYGVSLLCLTVSIVIHEDQQLKYMIKIKILQLKIMHYTYTT